MGGAAGAAWLPGTELTAVSVDGQVAVPPQVSFVNEGTAAAFGTEGPVLVAMDARRGQGYFQRFGYGDPDPFLSEVSGLDPVDGITCIGSLAQDAAAHLGGTVAPAPFAPASAIARIALSRFAQITERPKPLYLRAADAAPPREAPPTILA